MIYKCLMIKSKDLSPCVLLVTVNGTGGLILIAKQEKVNAE